MSERTPGQPGGIAVVGSANLDVVMAVARFPAAGETVLGDHLEEVVGGKGLNQAVAAARAGAPGPVGFVGRVGRDASGDLLVAALGSAGVDVAGVHRSALPTGRAFIQVTADGENTIVVLPLANGDLEPAQVQTSLDASGPSVVLCQLEIPLPCVDAAARWCERHGARFVLNASPSRDLPDSLLAACDPLLVNRAEAAALLADSAVDPSPGALARRVAALARSVAVTDGARGVHVGTVDGVEHLPGHPVRAVDTTGAGDEFAGALVAALSAGAPLGEAAAAANTAAARVVALARDQR